MEKKQYFVVDENGDVKFEFEATEGVFEVIWDTIRDIEAEAE